MNMERFSAEQAMHARTYREKTAQKNVAEEALHDLMESVSRTARSMKRSNPGAAEKFRLPSKMDGETWLATANAFAMEAVPLEEEFVRRGMAPDFVDDLKGRILAFKQAVDGQAAEKVAATTALAKAAEQGLATVRELDAIVRNIYAGNEAELAAWMSASHVERAPRRAAAAEEEETPPAQPTHAGG